MVRLRPLIPPQGADGSVISMPLELSSPILPSSTHRDSVRPAAQMWELKTKLLSAEAGFCPCILSDNPMEAFQGSPAGSNSWSQAGFSLGCVSLTHIGLAGVLKSPHPLFL